ncbi:pyrroloquinoline quinone biosynthesis peptide chaperone PqqD [Candidatus Spongiihabitans sp.]|uniref:pyrroloquinoline quinone biosynthesis peptide chaperone PqqD n=1 Tax=Candidatus Spongiihabitans sp. TaxID=3101308 RepID=UPI003C7032D2
MCDPISNNSVFTFSKLNRLQWEPAQEKHVILYPEGMVELNASSAAILKLCDGERSFSEIVSALEKQFSVSDINNEVADFLTTALEKNWVLLKT